MVQMISFAKQKQRHRHIEQTCGHQGEKAGDEMNWEVGIDVHTYPHLTLITD